MDRVTLLRQYVLDEPGEPFNYYALALECLKSDPAEAIRLFEGLMLSHPGYLPTYFPYAQLLIERKDAVAAEKVFHLGMSAARAQADAKTQREIQSAYNDWKYEQ